MARISYDLTRRTEDARRSTRRAEIRLAKEFNEAGGIEDEMRHNLSQMKRQRIHLERELQGLKFEAREYAKASGTNTEMTYYADHNVGLYNPETLASLAQRSRSASVKKSEYGKNFFGYHSAPGSHKKHNKIKKEMDSSSDDRFQKVDQRMQEERTQKQLQQQRKLNQHVQNKLDNWKNDNPIKTPKRYISFIETTRILHDSRGENEQSKDNATREEHHVSSDANENAESFQKLPETTLVDNKQTNSTQEKDEESHNKPALTQFSKEETSNQATNPLLQHQSSSFFFDADLYAPDGRIRMAHRMPEFNLAFDTARRTRYVRTKEKRDFEIPLSINQILH